MAIRSLRAIFARVNKTRLVLRNRSSNVRDLKADTNDHRFEVHLAQSFVKAAAAVCIASLAFSATGCSLTSGACRAVKRHDGLDNFMIGYRNQVLAARAWHEHKHCYANRSHQRDFKAGFMKGYADVANGSNGCVPSVAPPEYWGWRYQSADGQNAVNAWFAGYPLGAQLAEQDGVNNWSNIRPVGANAPQQRQAVYVPPVVPDGAGDSGDNPFYSDNYIDERYPYEPVQDDRADADAADAMTDDDISSPADQDAMELDDTPSPQKDVSDAIREALDSPVGDDSASNGLTPPIYADGSYVEPPYEPMDTSQVHVVIKAEQDREPEVQVINPSRPAVPQTADADTELRFSFE
jgi:hypothetical protein